MLTHPLLPDLLLFEVADLTTEAPHPALAGVVPALRSVVAWAQEYLCEPHPELGRKGPVCPYAQGSLDRGIFYLAVHRGSTVDPAGLDVLLGGYRDWFRQLEPVSGPAAQFKTILVTMPDLGGATARSVVDAAQERLKPAYTADGLMIGEFHDGPPAKGGLWNPDFRPLRSPLPLLAIRHMVPSDFPFLADDPVTLGAYLRLFAHSGPAGLRQQVAAAASRFGLPLPEPVAGGPVLRPVGPGVSA
ncbi:DUF6875 domain-containing protein [Micromonospora echinofusca]|uniref:DUF6875 domain-containing protein n=1 Tax=Micromonospora echinofusca TaxID=47858 RepID=A0ABS3VRS6_MICEH|nr:hypothetical protein [Micromonospora echinofusca]MBO4207178.1 hypothetical protein [Micromonospora echinofusca]